MKKAKNFATFLFICAAILMVGMPTFAQAPLAVEDFDLADGTALTSAGWTAHSGGGTNPVSVVSPGLTYTGYPSSGIGNAVALTISGEDVHKIFPAQTSGTVYAAFLANFSEASTDSVGGYFFHLGPDPISTTFRARVYAKKNAENQVAFAIGKGSTASEAVYTGFDYALNTTYLFVIKYTIVEGDANDTVSLFVNPAVASEPASATVSAVDTAQSDISPASYALRQGSNATSPTVTVDGIRIATSWEGLMGEAPSGPTANGPVDLDGDGYTDYVVVRNMDGTPSGAVHWFYNLNPANPESGGPTAGLAWGLSSDHFVTGDFDGDGQDDIAVWRSGPEALFYILHTGDYTLRIEQFGTEGDTPGVVGDYNGDNKDDLAVYRSGANTGDQSYWFYRTEPEGPITYVPWGSGGDFPAPGDYDGDGFADFVVQRAEGGNGAFWTLYNPAGSPATPAEVVFFGTSTDVIVSGDYDGDGKDDVAIIRNSAGAIQWWVRPSSDPANARVYTWGLSETDYAVPGDYDGDGKYDPAIWRDGTFWVLNSSTGYTGFNAFGLGSASDYPVANFRVF